MSVGLRPLSDPASLGARTLRGATDRGELADSKIGLGSSMRHAVALCPAASTSAGFFGVRRASEVNQLATNDVDLDLGNAVKGW